MTPARTPDAAPRRRPAPLSALSVRSVSRRSRAVETGRELPQPPRPLTPAAALRALQQMGVEHRVGDLRRRRLAVDTGRHGDPELSTDHPFMVPDGAGYGDA